MTNACPNCLAQTDGSGLCWYCQRIIDVSYFDDDKVDLVWIKQLKDRRMKSYARARKVARRG